MWQNSTVANPGEKYTGILCTILEISLSLKLFQNKVNKMGRILQFSFNSSANTGYTKSHVQQFIKL